MVAGIVDMKFNKVNYCGASNFKGELSTELTNFRSGRYPMFITNNSVTRLLDSIPVFSFHSISTDVLKSKLEYLKENDYRTITTDEYTQRDGKTYNERIVMLTFDDGPSELWTIGYPLLKKYKMKAVAFIMPGETKNATKPRYTEENEMGEIENGDELCAWPELLAMADYIDVQSHSLFHWVIFTSKKLVNFVTPKVLAQWPKTDLPIPVRDGTDDLSRNFSIGAPMYEMSSRLSDQNRYFEPQVVRNECELYAKEHGGNLFFNDQQWFNRLLKVHNRFEESEPWVIESDEERIESIHRCFFESKLLLEEKLQKSVSHFCLPFGIGSRTAMEKARETGYSTVHWGVAPPEFTKEYSETASVGRIKSDYIFRLPGKGRKSLASILAKKTKRRIDFHLFGKGSTR